MKNAENRIDLIKKTEGTELDETDLEKVDGGIKVIVGDGKHGTCKWCGAYSIMYDGYCYACKRDNKGN